MHIDKLLKFCYNLCIFNQNKKEIMALQPIKPTTTREDVIRELQAQMAVRLEAIDHEFTQGFNLLSKYQSTVTVFGSARFTEENPHYEKARELGGRLAKEGFAVITGGGGGIMEAANRGAYEVGGESLGFNIVLPHEQQLNPYVTQSLAFNHFYARKVMLVFSATALVCFPGGFGTLDEMFEVITLVQTKKTPQVPIILVGKEFWSPLDAFITETLRDKEQVISPGDEKLYYITDDLPEVVARIESYREKEVSEVFGATSID